MPRYTAENVAAIEPMVRRIVARFKDMDTGDLELGMLGYMVLHYEMTQGQQQAPTAEVQALRAELAALHRQVQVLEAMSNPGYWRGSRRRLATAGERAAYNAGYERRRLAEHRERTGATPIAAPEYEI